MAGWDKLREERFSRMKQLGIINSTTQLSPRDKNVPEWNSLTQKEKEDWDDKMAVYAAMVDRMDQNIGRIRQALKETGEEENTVVMFLSDNGASSESIKGPGFSAEIQAANQKPASDPSSFTAYGFTGANVSNTPLTLFKHWVYEGGTATPFIVSYPAVIKNHRESKQPGHLVDLMATCVDLAGAKYPSTYKGNAIKPTEGISLLPIIQSKPWKGHDAIFWEHEGNRAVRQGDWKLVSAYPANQWHLYNIAADRSEQNDMAAKYPDKVKALQALYESWANRIGVVPFEKLSKAKPDL